MACSWHTQQHNAAEGNIQQCRSMSKTRVCTAACPTDVPARCAASRGDRGSTRIVRCAHASVLCTLLLCYSWPDAEQQLSHVVSPRLQRGSHLFLASSPLSRNYIDRLVINTGVLLTPHSSPMRTWWDFMFVCTVLGISVRSTQ